MTTFEPWRSIKQFADHMSVNERTVRRWIRQNDAAIDVVQIAGTIRIRLRSDCPRLSADAYSPTERSA